MMPKEDADFSRHGSASSDVVVALALAVVVVVVVVMFPNRHKSMNGHQEYGIRRLTTMTQFVFVKNLYRQMTAILPPNRLCQQGEGSERQRRQHQGQQSGDGQCHHDANNTTVLTFATHVTDHTFRRGGINDTAGGDQSFRDDENNRNDDPGRPSEDRH